MQFEQRYAAGIQDGSVTLTFRRWKTPQVIAGNTYRTAAGRLVVDSVDTIEPNAISDAEARKGGYHSAAELVADLRGTSDLPIYRVTFHLATEPDPRDVLAASGAPTEAELAGIEQRLARLDRASPTGAWTRRTLELIAANPEVRAGNLAPQMGMELMGFKLNVRKLKNLGLTLSLGTGYRLSHRGEAFWTRANNSSAG